jgi:hypothetical protein
MIEREKGKGYSKSCNLTVFPVWCVGTKKPHAMGIHPPTVSSSGRRGPKSSTSKINTVPTWPIFSILGTSAHERKEKAAYRSKGNRGLHSIEAPLPIWDNRANSFSGRRNSLRYVLVAGVE